jgi:hypothetical protein
VWLLGVFTILYFTSTGLFACNKPLWYDELFTVHLAQLPRLADICSALADGTDLNPPLCHLATRAALVIGGQTPWAARLPAMVSFWVLCLCLFHFVRRRCSPLYAWIALIFPLATGASYYAYEARPYGLVLGFCGLSLVCWQTAAEGGTRRVALAGLTLSIAGAILSHYYAVLLVVPLALGELVRSISRKRLDLPVWLAVVLGVVPLGLLWPWMEQARIYAPHFWAKPGWDRVSPTYLDLMADMRTPLLVLLLVLVFYRTRPLVKMPSGGQHSRPAFPWHEPAAAIGLVTLPVLGITLGKFVTGVFTTRYVLPAVAGFAILVPLICFKRTRGKVFLARLVLGVLLAMVGVREVRAWTRLRRHADWLCKTCAYLEQHGDKDQVVAICNPVQFLELVHHGPPALVRRLVYLSDLDAAIRLGDHDTSERALRKLRQWTALKVVDFGSFIATHPDFLVYGNNGWLPAALQETGIDVKVYGRDSERVLLAVHRDVRLPAH